MGKRGYFSFAGRELGNARMSIMNVRYGSKNTKISTAGRIRSGEKCIEKILRTSGRLLSHLE